MRYLTALSWALCLMLFPAMIHAAGPGVITYQGSLTSQDGEPQASGAYDMEFKLWGAASGGDMHWMEAHAGGPRCRGHERGVQHRSGQHHAVS